MTIHRAIHNAKELSQLTNAYGKAQKIVSKTTMPSTTTSNQRGKHCQRQVYQGMSCQGIELGICPTEHRMPNTAALTQSLSLSTMHTLCLGAQQGIHCSKPTHWAPRAYTLPKLQPVDSQQSTCARRRQQSYGHAQGSSTHCKRSMHKDHI